MWICFVKALLMSMQVLRAHGQAEKHGQPSLAAEQNELMRNPPCFSRICDEAGDNGRAPRAPVNKSAIIAVMEGMEYWYHQQQQLVDGRYLGVDELHKITKKGLRSD